MVSAAHEAPIIVLDPDAKEGRQIAGWLRSAGLDMICTARTCDEAIFMLGRRRAELLIIGDGVSPIARRRLFDHVADCGHALAPNVVWLLEPDSRAQNGQDLRQALGPAANACDFAPTRDAGSSVIVRPLLAQDVVTEVGKAMRRPDLLGRMDRGRDKAAEHLAAARRMQLGLLPTADQRIMLQAECGIGLADFCQTGDAVGGDFWGAWPTGRGRLALALADFAGHGLSAALNTFRLHAILSERTLPRAMPARMTGLLNQRLHDLLPIGHYATMIYAQLDPARHRLAWSSSGGPPPLFVDAHGGRTLEASGLPLGVRAGERYSSNYAELRGPGILCLFSDGLYESGAGSEDIPTAAIASAMSGAAAIAAAGRLEEAASNAVLQLNLLRSRYGCLDHSDDVMAVAVALGPASGVEPPSKQGNLLMPGG